MSCFGFFLLDSLVSAVEHRSELLTRAENSLGIGCELVVPAW